MKKKIVAGLVTALAVSMFAAPANAEGHFETSVSGVSDGFRTRGWVDRNIDGYNTEITAATCLNDPHGSPGKVEMTLRRELSMKPDPDLGSRSLNKCYGGWDRGGWGRQAAGNYHADIHTFDWNHLTIKWMKFVW